MTTLIACLSSGKGTWSQVNRIMRSHPWDKVILVTNDFGKEKFSSNATLVVLDLSLGTTELRDAIYAQLRTMDIGTEVALNLSSGSGNEHMALIGAVLRLGVGLRFVDVCNDRLSEV